MVLGKWVDFETGYVGVGRADDAVYYKTNPGIEYIIESIDDKETREILYWGINEQALKIGMDSDCVFKYTFSGQDLDDIAMEAEAIKELANGNLNEAFEILDLDPSVKDFPFRLRELEYLIEEGYEITKIEGDAIYWSIR